MHDRQGHVWATMVISEGASDKGTVFSAATTDWVMGLVSDDLYPAMSQITINVLRRLGGL